MNKILFRGFHPDENGATAITLNGEKIKGRWVYGDVANNYKSVSICFNSPAQAGARRCRKVIPETVGQWVTNDINGKDIFEGDIVKRNAKKQNHTDTLYRVEYNPRQMLFDFVSTNKPCSTNGFCLSEKDFELIGNIWEIEE